jgi:glycosyltransferase involved in cell wall biosynthesis
MEVAINAQLVSFTQTYRNAGVSRYTQMLLASLGQLSTAAHGDAIDQRYTVFINAAEANAAKDGPVARLANLRLVPSRWSTNGPVRRIAWEQLALPNALRRIGADVFHSPVNVLPARVPCASVVTVHDLAFVRYPQYFRPSRRFYQRVLTQRSARSATVVAAVSESTKRDLVERMNVPPERIHVVYTGIAPDFRPISDPRALAAFRSKHSLPKRYLLYLGTLEPRKNLAQLVDAYVRLRGADPLTPPLIIAGAKGWYYQPLFERVRRLGAEGAITFVGYVSREEQPLWYAGATIFIYPSLYEGFGLPVVEALACGTPTITSNVSSLPEAAGPVATQVAPTDTDALVAAMRALLHDEEARRRVAAQGPRWAGQFTPERMAQSYRDLYDLAVARRRKQVGKRRG